MKNSLLGFFIILSFKIDAAPREFKSDLCTFFPESLFTKSWEKCCYDHDLAYWKGGSFKERNQVDLKFRSCMKKSSNSFIASVAYFGVWFGKQLPFTLSDRQWGNAWSKKRRYKTLSKNEASLINKDFEKYKNIFK